MATRRVGLRCIRAPRTPDGSATPSSATRLGRWDWMSIDSTPTAPRRRWQSAVQQAGSPRSGPACSPLPPSSSAAPAASVESRVSPAARSWTQRSRRYGDGRRRPRTMASMGARRGRRRRPGSRHVPHRGACARACPVVHRRRRLRDGPGESLLGAGRHSGRMAGHRRLLGDAPGRRHPRRCAARSSGCSSPPSASGSPVG